MEDQMRKMKVPAVAYGIIENGNSKVIQVVGELEEGVAAPEDAIFNVASVTKPVFGLLALKIIDSGKLGLDEPLYPYWVDDDIAGDPRHKLLTPRILLSHQSGFPNWRWNTQDKKLGFSFDPGQGNQYSGEGMEYLKNAITTITGKRLEQLADSLIFNPLGMKDTHFIWDEDMDEGRFARWHDSHGNQYEYWKRSEACAADDLMTTVDDLGKFAQYIISQKGGLSDSIFAEMITIQSETNRNVGYGLGWQVASDIGEGEYALVHGGSDMGVRARLVIMPESRRAFIAFTNGDNGQQLLDRIMTREFEEGKEILSKIYAPVVWRLIYLPFKIF